MSYQALARKWRPRNFAQVVGQSHVVRALSNALDNQRVHHAFLFTGTRGVGKTTLARIFAKALNCRQGVSSNPCGECEACLGIDQGRFVDLIEVDAASRTKVDDTRNLLDNVQYTPTQGRYKIYLIDEVHMLSSHSFNALLKTLEEPPEHVKFLLATTDPQKLPATILSRCIQFNLKALDIGTLAAHLGKVIEGEELEYDAAAALILARCANGSVRDSLSLLDQAIAFGDRNVDSENVRTMLGMIDDRFTLDLLQAIATTDAGAALGTIAAMAERAVDFAAALDELLTTFHNLALLHVSPQAIEWKGIDSAPLQQMARLLDSDWLQLLFQIGLLCKRDLALAPDPRSGFEMAVLRMICFQPEQLVSRPTTQPSSSATTLETRPTAMAGSDYSPKPATAAPPALVDQSSPKPSLGAQPKDTAPPLDASLQAEITAVSKDAAGKQSMAALADLSQPDNWADFVKQAGFVGLQKELVYNLLPRESDGKRLVLDLRYPARHLLSNARVRKIEQHCKDILGVDLNIRVEVKKNLDPQRRTLAETRDQSRAQRQQQAEQSFSHDQYVQELVDRFDAEIIPESIQPHQQRTG